MMTQIRFQPSECLKKRRLAGLRQQPIPKEPVARECFETVEFGYASHGDWTEGILVGLIVGGLPQNL